MKNIQISKSDRLYRVFNWFAMSSMYSFIYYNDDGQVNSFNDVCTFITHCFRILLSSLGYLIVTALVGFLLVAFAGIIVIPFILGFFDLYNQEYSIMTASVVVIPLIIYLNYRYQLSKQFPKVKAESDDESSLVGKFTEIVSSRSNVFCVKIDVVEADDNAEVKYDK